MKAFISHSMRFAKYILLLAFVVAFPVFAQAKKPHAVVFSYYNIGNDGALSLPGDVFAEQLSAIRDIPLRAVSLKNLVSALKDATPVNAPTIAMTFDNPTRATLDAVFPLIEKYHVPIALFITSEGADNQTGDQLSWDDLIAVKKNELVTIGLMGKNYRSYIGMNEEERLKSLNEAFARFESKLGFRPQFLPILMVITMKNCGGFKTTQYCRGIRQSVRCGRWRQFLRNSTFYDDRQLW